MTAKVAVRKRDAEKVLAAVKRKFAPYIAAGYDPPVLLKDWDWTGYGGAPYTIVWEGGPYDWAVELGWVNVPGVFAEPITGWALGLYAA